MLIRTVYTVGAFDILHEGHINLLKTSHEYCGERGILIVGLLTDKVIEEYKRKPYVSYYNRLEVMRSIRYVDHVIPADSMSYKENVERIQPDIVVNADDWVNNEKWFKHREELIELLNQYGGKLIEPPYTEGISTTQIVNTIIMRSDLFNSIQPSNV